MPYVARESVPFTVQLEAPEPAANFRVDERRREISGTVIPWGKIASNGWARWRFARDSLHWSQVNRIKLNRHHDRADLIGRATALRSSTSGLDATFKLGRNDAASAALQDAEDEILDGFSVEIVFDDDAGDSWQPDPVDESVRLVTRASLRGVALTGAPAFDDARVESVAASRDQRLELRLSAEEVEGVRMAAESVGVSMSDLVRTQLRHYTLPRPTYPLDSAPTSPSLVRDSWHVMNQSYLGSARDAQDRLTAHMNYMRRLETEFATATTTTAAAIVPPGYEPLLADSTSDRPLFAAANRGGLSDATPFVVPGTLTEASVETGADVVAENVQPTEATAAFVGQTITPVGIKGVFRVTREIVDASNPAIDAVLFAAMREDYDRQAEKQIFTELNTVQSGTITAGLVPSGAQARTSAGTALPADLRKAILNYVDVRKRKARSVVASSRASVSDALESLDLQAWALRDVTVDLSPWITGVAAGDGDVFILATGDLWAWASPLLDFRFMERVGPSAVDLAVYGYFATKIIKPAGLASIRHT